MSFEIDLSGKVALITGVTSGIGSGAAKAFARAGAKIAGCGLETKESSEAIAFLEEMKLAGADAVYSCTDLTRPDQINALTEEVLACYGRIDILVSNAGANVFEGAENCSEERWMENHQLNLTSHWRLAKACKPALERQDGTIIIMSSNHAFSSIPGCFPYNITKTALTGLVRSLAIEWGPAIRTVGLSPGFIDTPGNQTWFNSFDDPQQEKEKTIGLHPVKRLGTTTEIGGWCVFLASEYAAFASGVTYLIDGGRSALMQD
ncbi:SDR family NAD(P)-dependent oxidoreductase [Pedobacter cryoconitis]|uniref:NAD(P)-dependent dehydrogenase (Short-subunit alcohol dehydrogenase family) n=1 Tax=Pedobacter cryoconitis TaxID=188932 RepID=A0A7X0J6F4_9SPHI|nr:SDR family oxidoreductase [Pedobacter cryoconitis]MBB6501955.1 NAD(P)-dependent dehydrogenase (short-subunit alcohol dehydrogenase family) [Pedobacter cryoconitis]